MRTKHRQLWMWFGIVSLWLLLTHATGCSIFSHHKALSSITETKITVANSTNQVYSSLYWLFVAGIVIIAGGIAAMIILPGDDHIPYGIIGGGLALTGLSLFFIVTLPVLKWLIFGLVCVGIILVIRVVITVWKVKSLSAAVNELRGN